MMLNVKWQICLAAVLTLTGCGGTRHVDQSTEENRQIRLKYGGREVSFEPTYTRFATFKKGLILKDSDIQNKDKRVPAVVHRIYLANYDLHLTDPAKQDYRRVDAEGQFRVEIQLEAEKDATEDARPRLGEYTYKVQPFDRISHVFLSYMKDGNDRSENLQAAEFGGKLRITSITETEIAGEIDVSDKNEFVKGSFKAWKLLN